MKTTSFPTLRLLSALSLLLLLPACEDESTESSETKAESSPIAKVKDRKDEVAEGQELDDYTYNPLNKKDPFRSFISGEVEDEIRSPTPLQKYSVEQFLLTAIVWGVDDPKAMVQDPARDSHVIELGTYIGTKWGKVTQITSTEVIVTEELQDLDGDLVAKQRILKLPVRDLVEEKLP